MQEFSGKDIPLVPEGLRGYREWQLNRDGELLRATNQPTHWVAGINEARCLRTSCTCPGCVVSHDFSTCVCGFYARYRSEHRMGHRVRGVIEATGRVILGTEGFRASKARIVALYSDMPMGKTMERYPGVPLYKNFDKMVRKFPSQDMSHLIDVEGIRKAKGEELARKLGALGGGTWHPMRYGMPAASGFASIQRDPRELERLRALWVEQMRKRELP